MYEYKFVRIDEVGKIKSGFEKCREEIEKNAKDGWRFIQVIMLPNDKLGLYHPDAFEIIFEREK